MKNPKDVEVHIGWGGMKIYVMKFLFFVWDTRNWFTYIKLELEFSCKFITFTVRVYQRQSNEVL